MGQVHWTPAAENDLHEIAFHIAVTGGRPKVAEQVVEAIVAKAEQYAHFPDMGNVHADLPAGIRSFSHTRYVAFYRKRGADIHILRVVDGARDFPSIFGKQG
jgi:plasmid stabilization system protein ParE